MQRYRTRPGVVLAEICGEYLLVAAASAREQVPYLTQLNESSAFLWKQLQDGADEKDLEAAVQREYEISEPAAAHAAIRAFLDQMLGAGYLLPEEEGENHEE